MLSVFDRFRRKSATYDYPSALARLTAACNKSEAYNLIACSVFYDTTKGMFAVHFECANREYYKTNSGKRRFFLSVRRDEKFWSEDLETLIDFCITYANYSDAFIRAPHDNLPDGVSVSVKNFTRVPHNDSLKWKLK